MLNLREKENLSRYRAEFEGNLLRFARARADNAKLARGRDALCSTKGLPRVQPQMRYDWLMTSLKRE